MWLIGICDDEQVHRQHIRELCERFFENNPQSHHYVEFTSGEELLVYQERSPGMLHLLFLDIEMGGVDGIEVLRQVEDADWIWRIVFVSSHEEMVWDSFSIRTLEFARKPVAYPQIEKWIRTAIRENQENVLLEYMDEGVQKYIALEDIYYLAAEGNYTQLHGRHHTSLQGDKLKQWQQKTEDMPFVRIHKSYLINMLHVKKWEAGKVILESGVTLPIGRQYTKEAKEIYTSFVRKQAMKRM